MKWNVIRKVEKEEALTWTRNAKETYRGRWDGIIPQTIIVVDYDQYRDNKNACTYPDKCASGEWDVNAYEIPDTYDAKTNTITIITNKTPDEYTEKEADRMHRYSRWIDAGYLESVARARIAWTLEDAKAEMDRLIREERVSGRDTLQKIIDNWN